jgi:hypothetical protein
MSTVRISPADAIAKAEVRIQELTSERQAKLETGEGDEYLPAVVRIDAEIATLRAKIEVYRQRAEAMDRRPSSRRRRDWGSSRSPASLTSAGACRSVQMQPGRLMLRSARLGTRSLR